MTSKQRSYLKSLANDLDPIFQIGKSSLTPEFTSAVSEAFNTRELVKVAVLKNCMDDPKAIAEMLAGRTRSQVVLQRHGEKENGNNGRDFQSDSYGSSASGRECERSFRLG